MHEQAAYSHVCSSACTHRCSVWFFFRFVHTFRVHEFHIVFERAVRLCACLELVILFYSILFIHLVFVRCLFVCTQIQRYFLSCSLVRPRIYISSLFLLKIHKLMLNMNLLLLLLLLRALLYPNYQTGYIISFLSIYRSHDFSFGLCGAAHTSPSSLPRRSIDSIS